MHVFYFYRVIEPREREGERVRVILSLPEMENEEPKTGKWKRKRVMGARAARMRDASKQL